MLFWNAQADQMLFASWKTKLFIQSDCVPKGPMAVGMKVVSGKPGSRVPV